jgi:hypothetical protein
VYARGNTGGKKKINISREITLNNLNFKQKQEPASVFPFQIGEIPLSFGFLYAILLSNSISWLFRG